MKNEISFEKVFQSLVSKVQTRGKDTEVLNEECIRTDLIYSFSSFGIESHMIIPEYQNKQSSGRLDLYVKPNIHLELKYLRQIQTSSQRPRAKWLGGVLNDLLTLKSINGRNFFLCLCDEVFQKYLRRKGIDFGKSGKLKVNFVEDQKQKVSIGLPKTSLDEIYRLEELGNKEIEFHISVIGKKRISNNLVLFLLEIS